MIYRYVESGGQASPDLTRFPARGGFVLRSKGAGSKRPAGPMRAWRAGCDEVRGQAGGRHGRGLWNGSRYGLLADGAGCAGHRPRHQAADGSGECPSRRTCGTRPRSTLPSSASRRPSTPCSIGGASPEVLSASGSDAGELRRCGETQQCRVDVVADYSVATAARRLHLMTTRPGP
jgi:hypothetical protein